ncbi:MAG: hypothetical protein A2W99_03785 [Bacteroidetes bacterium GWF2_33_16]|nr:MAG: hypothetical protein A2X00_12195 [Bacteroidetes bacterium GWE2_32_14]OFY02304.1 MAG: hypothetical protein A2W99_03785 [Bacteroidetes bacterium GWF2_33_16]
MEINAYTKGELSGSFVYFIFARELVYIGESQKVAFTRWHSHLYESGTLRKKITEFGDPSFNYLNSLHFISVNCSEIRKGFSELKWKVMTQAVEHSIHKFLYLSQKELIDSYYSKYEPDVTRYKIISDTSRTAPARMHTKYWDFADNYAVEVIESLCNYF